MVDYYQSIFWTESIATFLIQLYIFYLLVFECTPEMKEYAYYMKLLAWYDFLHNLTFGILVSPRPIYPVFGFEVNGLVKYFGIKSRVFCTALSLYCGSMIVFVQLYCLVYRYSIFGPYKSLYRRLSSIWCKIGIQIILQSAAIALSVYYFTLFCLDENCLVEFMKRWNDTKPLIQLTYAPVVAIDFPYGFLELVMKILFPLQIASFILVYLALKTLKKNVASMTPDTYRLYRQFTILLGAQLLTPLVFLSVPVIINGLFSFFNIATDEIYVEIGDIGILSYGLVNSLLTVLFITPFRKHTAKTFVYWWLEPLLRLLKCSKCLKWLNLDDVIPSVQGSTVTKVIVLSSLK